MSWSADYDYNEPEEPNKFELIAVLGSLIGFYLAIVVYVIWLAT